MLSTVQTIAAGSENIETMQLEIAGETEALMATCTTLIWMTVLLGAGCLVKPNCWPPWLCGSSLFSHQFEASNLVLASDNQLAVGNHGSRPTGIAKFGLTFVSSDHNVSLWRRLYQRQFPAFGHHD